ncbi:hypothetical protein L2E82_04993 [Cichorium intybus]|uniref:Uncharacterized protein n=1 Tax=Cichorium intybus TaxID=13427 RepID=A0ACB9H5Y0_CICIN|nr:hypothetical protein L2E82_04993 [Cichorium intybus]
MINCSYPFTPTTLLHLCPFALIRLPPKSKHALRFLHSVIVKATGNRTGTINHNRRLLLRQWILRFSKHNWRRY